MSEQFDEYQVEQFEQAAYQGAMLEAGKEWERQREEYDLHEAEWQARAENAEAMVERLISLISFVIDDMPAYNADEWQALVAEWERRNDKQEAAE